MALEKSVGREEDKNGSEVVSYYTNVIAGDKGNTLVNTASRSPVVLCMLPTTGSSRQCRMSVRNHSVQYGTVPDLMET